MLTMCLAKVLDRGDGWLSLAHQLATFAYFHQALCGENVMIFVGSKANYILPIPLDGRHLSGIFGLQFQKLGQNHIALN